MSNLKVAAWEPKTREEARAFLKRAGLLKKTRTIAGQEREELEVMLSLLPSEVSNNQRIFTETWQVGGITYHHYLGTDIDELEEEVDDDI